MLLLQLL